MHPLKVLLVAPKPPPNGGIGRWTVLLLRWLETQQNIDSRHVDISPRWRAVDDLNMIKRMMGGGLQGIRDAWRVLLYLARFRPDVLHLTTSGSLAVLRDIVVLSMARCFGVRTLYHIRMGRLPQLVGTSGWAWRSLSCALRLADRVMVIDTPSEAALSRVLPVGKLLRLPNAIDLKTLKAQCEDWVAPKQGESDYQARRFQDSIVADVNPPHSLAKQEVRSPQASAIGHQLLAIKNSQPPTVRRVLYLGWVIPTKGMRELMAAWRSLKPTSWQLVVAGPGNAAYRQELSGAVGEGGNVCFLGEVSPAEAWRQMQQAEVFVLPSHTEGFPNVILEAMAAGKGIVATHVGAVPEMLDADTPRPCGLVVAPRDVSALAEALRRIMEDENLRRDLGRQAQAKVIRFYESSIVFRQLAETWRQLTASTRYRLIPV